VPPSQSLRKQHESATRTTPHDKQSDENNARESAYCSVTTRRWFPFVQAAVQYVGEEEDFGYGARRAPRGAFYGSPVQPDEFGKTGHFVSHGHVAKFSVNRK